MKTYQLRKVGGYWQLQETGKSTAEMKWVKKKDAVNDSINSLRKAATNKEPISLRICNKHGEMRQEFTYPKSADPRKSEG